MLHLPALHLCPPAWPACPAWQALELDERNTDALVARGAALANAHDFQRASDDLENALQLQPDHRNAAAYLQAVQGRAAERGVALRPRSAAAPAGVAGDAPASAAEGAAAAPAAAAAAEPSGLEQGRRDPSGAAEAHAAEAHAAYEPPRAERPLLQPGPSDLQHPDWSSGEREPGRGRRKRGRSQRRSDSSRSRSRGRQRRSSSRSRSRSASRGRHDDSSGSSSSGEEDGAARGRSRAGRAAPAAEAAGPPATMDMATALEIMKRHYTHSRNVARGRSPSCCCARGFAA